MPHRTQASRILRTILIATSALILATCDNTFQIGLGDEVDIEPPRISITSTTDANGAGSGGYFDDDIIVSGTVADDLSSPTVTLSWPGGSVAGTVTGTAWTATVPLSMIATDGTYEIAAVATDASGKDSAPAMTTVRVDRNAPTVLITTPQTYNAGPTKADNVIIQGESWDVSPIESVVLHVFDPANLTTPLVSQEAEGDRSWFTRVIFSDHALTDGTTYVYRIIATDAAGNVNTYQYHASDIWAVLPGGALFPSMVEIGQWDQNGSGITDIDAAGLTSISNARVSTDPNSSTLDFTADSNIDSPQISFANLDPNVPTAENAIGERVPIFASAIDDEEGVDTATVSLSVETFPDGTPVTTVSGQNFASPGDGLYTSFEFPLTGADELAPGLYTATVDLADRQGNASSSSVAFIVDSGAPQIAALDPSGSFIGYTSGNVTLTVTVQDDNSGTTLDVAAMDADTMGALAVTLAGGGESQVTVGSDTVWQQEYTVDITIDPLNIPNDIHVALSVEDVTGFVNSRTSLYTLDSTPPTVAVTTPSAGAQISGNATTVAGTASNDALWVYVYFDDGVAGPPSDPKVLSEWSLADGNQTWSYQKDLSAAPETNFTLYVFAEDIAGNVSAVESTTFSYDFAAPSVTESAIGVTSTVRRNTNFQFNGTSSDSNGIDRVVVEQSKDGGAATEITVNGPSSGDSWATWTLPSLPRNPASIGNPVALNGSGDGQYEYVIKAVDVAGKESVQVLRNIVLDTVAPAVDITQVSPLVGTSTVNGTITVSVSATDANGLNGVKWSVLPVADPAPTFSTAANSFGGSPYTTTIDTTTLVDLSDYTVWILAQDKGGNETAQSFTFTVDQGSDVPSVSLSNLDSSVTAIGDASTNLLEFNAEIIGNALDDDAVDATAVEIQVDLNGDNDYLDSYDLNGDTDTSDPFEDETVYWLVSTPPGTDSPSASFRHDLTSLPEGVHKFNLRIADVNGVTTTTPDIYFVIDKSAPVLGSIIPANGSGANADFSIGGTVSDSAGLKNIDGDGSGIPDVEWGVDGVNYTTVATDAAGPSTSTTFSIPITVATYGEGTQSFYVRATDVYGKTTVSQIQILIDTAGPTVSYLFPASGASLNGLATIRGTASDANQVASVEYSLDGGEPSGTWNAVTGDVYSWSFSFDTRPLPQGAMTLKVRATDSAGNQSAVADLPLTLDQASDYPVIDLINLNDLIQDAGSASGNLLESNAKVQGTVTDDDWVDAGTLEISVDGSAYVPVATVGSSSTSVSFEHPLDTLADGVHSLSFRVSDTNDGPNNRKGGLPAVETDTAGSDVYFALDKANPTVVVDPPASTYTTGPFTMSGTVSDGNTVSELLVSTDGGATYAATGVTFTSGPGLGGRAWSWSGDLSAKPEGPFTLKVKGVDEFNKESISDLVITVDRTGPVMAISTPNASATVNGPVNLSGTGSETYGFSLVEIALDSNGNGVFTDPNDLGWTAATGTYAWSYALDSTLFPTGTYELYVRGTDEAGNVTAAPPVRAFVIDQSSDAPTIELATLALGGSATDNLLPGSLQISGTASDDDSVENTSLQIRVDVDGDGQFLSGGLENWAAISGQPSIDSNVATWSHTFGGLADGQYTFEMRVGDINFAGDYTDAFKSRTIGPVNFSKDSSLPTGTIASPAQGAYVTDPGSSELVITGTAFDASGVQSVEISVDGGGPVPATTANSWADWTYTYSLSGEGQVSYQIIITDTYGKVFTIDRYFTVDTVAPAPAFTEPAAAATVNGSLLIRGTTTEANQVSAVHLWIGGDAAVPPGNPATGDFTGWTTLTGTFNWSHRVDTTAWADGTYDVHVRAVDNAGNVSADTVLENLVFDQSTNLPVIGFSNLSASPAVNLFGSGASIQGTVSDDDTVDATSIQISFDNGGSWVGVSSPGSNSGTVTFSHDLSGIAESGTEYTVLVRASDVGSVNPGDAVQTTTTASYQVAIDRSVPTVAAAELSYTDRYTAAPLSVTGGAMSGALINNNFTLFANATDASGLTSVEVAVTGGTFDGTYGAAVDEGGGSWSFPVSIDVAGQSDDGTLSFTIRATDVWGRTSTNTLAVVIDTAEPTVSYLEPGAGANVNGDVTVRGTTFDAGQLVSLEIVGGLTPVSFTNGGTLSNWTTTFDSTLYDNATYATDNGDTTWAFPLSVTVYDEAGNRTIANRTVNLDPNGDKPVVVDATFLPADNSSVAGTIVLQSSVTDDDSPAFVRVYADLNNDGDYADSFAYDLNGDTDTTDPFETEGAYLEVPVSNGTWTALVNENSEFGLATMTARGVPSPDGFMKFFVVPYDVNGLAGNEAIRTIYIDVSSPEILNLNYSNAETVRASITLTGTIRDDALLAANRMKISFDGGTTFQDITIDSGPTDLGDGYQTYTFSETIDTTSYFADSSGNLDVAIQVTDATFKQSNLNLSFNVDNARPEVEFNNPVSLPFLGTPPNEIYSFYGDGTGDSQNQLFGSATDAGVVSGIAKVNVYFVKNGNFYSPVNGAATAVSNSTVYNQAGTQDSIPFTEDANYVITIDNRIEQGQFDQTTDIGDFDGFQESLRAKVGYDEWYAFYDTTVLPDGPLDIYFVAYDDAGNTSYGRANGQVANNPPTIDSVEITAGGTPYTGLFKQSGSLFLRVNASDVEGIDATTYRASITGKVVAPNGATTTDGPALGTIFDIADTADGAANEITIDLSESPATDFVSGVQYTITIEVQDTDGNLTTSDVEVWVNNLDSTAPTVTIDPFTQANLPGAAGHIEEAANSPDSDGEADLSGTVRITGETWDDTTVASLELSFDGGVTWTTVPGGSITSTASDVITGYFYDWYYDWDTSTVAGVAAPNVVVVARATDGAANTGTDSVTVDVVPYITTISGTGFDSGLLTYVKRSAAGVYPVRSGVTLTVAGYNLPGTAANSVSIDGGAVTLTPTGGGTTSISVDMTGITTSGTLEVTTNGVTSRNNTNDNALAQNQEPSVYNPSLTDNRSVAFWSVAGLAGTADVEEARMHPNAGDTDFDWMYVRNGKGLYLQPGGGAESLLTEGTALSGGDFTYNASGTLMFLFNHNAQWSFSDDSYRYTGGIQWGAIPNLTAYNAYKVAGNYEAYNWNQNRGIPRLGLGNVSFSDAGATLPPAMSYGYSALDLNRYRSLRLETVGTDATTRNYVAYFDAGASESRSIVFYAFKAGTNQANVQSQTVTDLFYEAETATNKLDPWIALASSENEPTNLTEWYANVDKHYNTLEDFSVALTGNQGNNSTGLATPRGRQEVTTAQAGDDSSDLDLAVYEAGATSHYGFIAYFDESSDGRSLMITANEDLYAADPAGVANSWTTPVTVDAAGGADVAMAVDPNGGIHLAYQSSSGYLKYAYLTYDDAANAFSVVNSIFVDALFGAGTNNAIAIRDFGGADYRPVITTFSSAFTGTTAAIRMSYPLSSPATVGAGANESTGAFTGTWETIALPAVSSPETQPIHLFVDGSGRPHLGYDGSTLEEATFLGF